MNAILVHTFAILPDYRLVSALQNTMEGSEDSGGGEVVQVIMQDDGQIVMPEGQFIQLDTENSQMQYIQVTVLYLDSTVNKHTYINGTERL